MCLFAAALAVGVDALAQTSEREPAAGARADSVLRYVSLKADKVYLRKGPGTDYPIARVYERIGLPVEVIREFDVWRQVRDAAGTVGWVHSVLLSGRRTALVLPWEVKEGQGQAVHAILRNDGNERARAVARVEAGALVGIVGCENGWCRVSLDNQRGYIEQTKLWGTYPNEAVR
jgi:SH3-like domain-containing protein